MSKDETRKMSLDELPELRRKTEAVSNFLHGQLAKHLETLRPLVAPGRILGKYADASSEAVWGKRALTEVEQKYTQQEALSAPSGIQRRVAHCNQ